MLVDLGELSRRGSLDWLTTALVIAADAAPGLDLQLQRRRIAALAEPLADADLRLCPPAEQARLVADYLYGELGFRGNDENYEDPANSLIHYVLDRRMGIAITLALIYVELARRSGVDARGVSFPGHFLVKVNDVHRTAGVDRSVFVDPLGGALLEEMDLSLLAERATGSSEVLDGWLEVASPQKIALRMLNNLRVAYRRRGDLSRLLVVLHRMCELQPDSGALLRDRGLLQAKLGAPRAAVSDLESYLHSMPHASDVQEVQELLDEPAERLHRDNPLDALN